ncbi:MAG: hypothetical protein M3291_00285 [Actinomycetota bacterium]|nr:hypothetical protein [Actinomycetota bacterium]
MRYHVAVRTPGLDVEAWSSVRLPFEPKGWLVDFRRDLAHACRTLDATPRQVLHATYTSAGRRPADLENILTYNLGTGAVRTAAKHGLMLERVYTPADDGEHHYRYRLMDQEQQWTHWAVSAALGSIHLRAPAIAFAEPKTGRWWLHSRRGDLRAPVQTASVPDRFVLRITVSPPGGWRGSLVSLVKPLVDGLISAMHAHDDSSLAAVLSRSSSIDPDLTPTAFRALLKEPSVAPLGRVRLVVPWGTTLQWLPADDRIVALDIRLCTDREPGTVTAEAMSAVALGHGWT